MNYFLTTRKPILIYKIYLEAYKTNYELNHKKKLKFLFLKNYKIPSLDYVLFLFLKLLSGEIFDKKIRSEISYRNIKLGNHVLSYTYRNFKSYQSIVYFYYILVKNFYIDGCYIKSSEVYLSKYNFECVYLDHIMYLNGIYYQIFSQKKKIIYSNNYPKSVFKINFKKKNKYLNYTNAIKLAYLKKNLSPEENKKIERFKKKYLKKISNFVPHLKNTKYERFDLNSKLNFEQFEYVIFPHSFTDAQLMNGFDGFESTFDWLIFTLEFMQNNNKKIIIKAHPNYFKKEFGILSHWDKKIFEEIKRKYESNKNFFFINKSIDNLKFLKKLNSHCIGLTHHGSVMLEMALLNFKTISSSKCPWESKYKISNQWSDVEGYEKLLNKKWDHLNFYNTEDLNKLYFQLYFNDFSFYGKYSIHEVIKKSLGKSIDKFRNNKNFFSTDASIKDISKQEKIFEKSFPVKNQKKFIDLLSKNIEEL